MTEADELQEAFDQCVTIDRTPNANRKWRGNVSPASVLTPENLQAAWDKACNAKAQSPYFIAPRYMDLRDYAIGVKWDENPTKRRKRMLWYGINEETQKALDQIERETNDQYKMIKEIQAERLRKKELDPCVKCGTAVFKVHAYAKRRIVKKDWLGVYNASTPEDNFKIVHDYFCGHCRPKQKKTKKKARKRK